MPVVDTPSPGIIDEIDFASNIFDRALDRMYPAVASGMHKPVSRQFNHGLDFSIEPNETSAKQAAVRTST